MLWRGLQSAVRVQSERHIGNETSHETRYFLSTLPVAEAQRAAEGVRGHLGYRKPVALVSRCRIQ